MTLSWLIVVLAAGAVLAWLSERWHSALPRWISLAVLAIGFALALGMGARSNGRWFASETWSWIPTLGISFRLGMDGLSLSLILLAFFLGIVSVAASWTEIRERVGFFHFNLLWALAGVVGIFLALDLFLFFFFWEVMLVPIFFLIALWGHENRMYAALKFFIFTQGGGILMLVAILALATFHYRSAGILTFDYFSLLGTPLDPAAARWIMAGFFVAFAVKLPVVPLHPWLPDAHTEAPTAGSVILAGLLLKTGAYGILRFVLPLFPDTAAEFAPIAMTLGVIGVLYGAVLAFAQADVKRLVAYTSISHMGMVLTGAFAGNDLALQGVVMLMLAHGVSTGALFMLAGALQERIHTRDMARMGGLWAVLPRMGAIGLFFAIASLGLPGLSNFVGEFLVLLGAFRVNPTITAASALGLIVSVIYALSLVQRIFHGQNRESRQPPDLSVRETVVLAAMMAITLWLGLYPQPVFEVTAAALHDLQSARAP